MLGNYPSGESGGQILPSTLQTSTGTTPMRYENTGITNSFPPYKFSFLGGSKKRKGTKKRIQRKHKSKRGSKTRKSRKMK